MAAEGDVPIAAAAEGDVAVGDEIAVAAAAAEKEDVAVGDEIAVEAEEEDVAVGAEEEDVAVGAEKEQQVPVEIWSLRMGLVHTVKLLGNPTMKVCAVNLSHAAALQAVLSRKKARAIIGLELLGPISYVDRLLTLGIDALLPNVADEDRSVASLRALSVWSWDIEEAAAGIPGNLFHDLRQVGVRVRMVVAAALNGNPAEEWLKQRLQEVIASLTAMRNSPVYLTQTDEEEEEEGNYYVEDEEDIMEEVQVAEVVLDTLEIFSPEDGAEFAAEVVGKAIVRICGVEMRHATALELLLTNQVADKGWDVPELEQLRYIARFDLLLTLGLNAHVPVVGGNMSTTSYLCAFKTWSWEAQWVARAALREEHFEKVKQLMQKVRRWVSAAHKGRSPVLITNLQQIRASLRELKTGYVYL